MLIKYKAFNQQAIHSHWWGRGGRRRRGEQRTRRIDSVGKHQREPTTTITAAPQGGRGEGDKERVIYPPVLWYCHPNDRARMGDTSDRRIITTSESMSFVKRLLANPSCSFKLYTDTQIIQNSFQNYTTIISISQVKKIRFSILDHILNTYEISGSFHTLTEERGILLNYVHRCQAEKWNEIGKYPTKMKNIKGSFPLECDHTIYF